MLEKDEFLKLIYTTQIYRIDSHNYIKVNFYEKRNSKFYQVQLVTKDKEIFLGKFEDENKLVRTSFNEGKILIYYEDFIREVKKVQITEVLAFYNVEDDTFYSCTQEEALEKFDKTIKSSYLKNKDDNLIRADIDRKVKLDVYKDLRSCYNENLNHEKPKSKILEFKK